MLKVPISNITQASGAEDKPFPPSLNNQAQPNVTKNNQDNRKYYQTHHHDDMKVLSTHLSLFTRFIVIQQEHRTPSSMNVT